MIDDFPLPPPARRIYCNRTLNMRSIRAVGFDMDYTLIHYRTEAWERSAYEYARRGLVRRGFSVEELRFDREVFALGLVIDTELGNVVKANRFGYVKRAFHGTRPMPFEEQRDTYARVLVDLAEPRWVFMNTLFSLSEATLYAQTVDLLDAGKLQGVLGYGDLYRAVKSAMDEAHLLGELKAEISAAPERFVELDPEVPLALMDLRAAGKKTLLITNSEWGYTRDMMSYAFDRFLPGGTSWRELFDVIIVGARKPSFFAQESPVFEVVDDAGLLRPVVGGLESGRVYLGGHAGLVEAHIGVSGEQILFVGDHIFADVNVSKKLLRWRTALVLRELERELDALESFKPKQAALSAMMEEKELVEHRYSALRLGILRLEHGYGPQPSETMESLRAAMDATRAELLALDAQIAPLAQEASVLSHPNWGLLLRAGNDKSHLAR
ncbi:MAG: HAD-IG family 5'-nucleotidase, partial [Polyangiaceae bacterium]|nr:HAD-IG family 5'-nucleotidase [Polyangiaceae bacterium]